MEQNNHYKDKRIFERFTVKLPVKFLDLESNQEGDGESLDISARGLGLISNYPLKSYVPLEMWLEVDKKSAPFYTRGKVVWVKPHLNNWRAGVEFEDTQLMEVSRILRRN